ncbi:hypothetical protein CERSUDRAFT_84750 [Gelatoporia subvermispora B]|uniref:MARVEL domain-containing protein n=1 Tax=Ceriporiopsis subvermispora (strain B) TaxID=914234 RepID=M2QWR1_CERS8|nr:hypothetical protein CERSUDRAFT_84750 [Gelatoporia subvermispora B]
MAVLNALRLSSLALTFVFGVVGMALGINALVKSNNSKNTVKKSLPAGATADIDTSDVFSSGVVETVVCGLIALTAAVALVFAALSHPTYGAGKARGVRAVSWPAHVLTFLSVWLFATLVPFTDFVANRSAKVSGTIGGMPLQPATIQIIQSALGLTTVYHKIDYLRNAAILPWFALLFAATSAALSYISARRTAAPAAYTNTTGAAQPEAAEVSPVNEKGATNA